MHILQVSDFYRPIIGGLERHVETLSQELVRLGHSVTVVTLQPGDHPAEETINGVRVVRIHSFCQRLPFVYAGAALPFHPTVPDPGAMAALHRVVKRERPAVVHSHNWLMYSYLPLHHVHRGPAHVVTLHDYGLTCARKTLQLADRVFVGSAGHQAPSKPSDRSCSGPQLAKCLACTSEQFGVIRGAALTTGLRASRAINGRADRYIAISTAVAEAARQGLPSDEVITVIPTMVPNNLTALARSIPRPTFLP
jgi:glycosyltransferase involved in cell wall biosynthesis